MLEMEQGRGGIKIQKQNNENLIRMWVVAFQTRKAIPGIVQFYKSGLPNGRRHPVVMVTFTFLFFVAFLVFPSLALPQGPLIVRPNDPKKILCQLPILKYFLCPLSGSSATNRPTPLGTAHGTVDSSGAYRFPVKYASAPRWGASTLVTAWDLPYVHFLSFAS
jgi:hypothetical protein